MDTNTIDDDRFDTGLVFNDALHSVKELNQYAITESAHDTINQVIALLNSLNDSDFYKDDYDDIPF